VRVVIGENLGDHLVLMGMSKNAEAIPRTLMRKRANQEGKIFGLRGESYSHRVSESVQNDERQGKAKRGV